MSARQMRRARERRLDREHRMGAGNKAAMGAGAALGATVLFAPAAQGATFTVTSLGDAGQGTLRQEIADANAAAGPDDLVFQSALTGTITLLTGQIDITQPLTISGPGASALAVNGNDLSRIFYVPSAGSLAISGLTIEEGLSNGPNGGAMATNLTDVTLTGTVFRDNRTTDAPGSAAGAGAVQVEDGDLAVADSSFVDNVAYGSGGALYAAKTGYTTTITNSIFSGNRAERGGVTSESGGALYLGGTEVSISGSTFTNNRAEEGGALYSYGSVSIANSTFTGNTAEADYGGAIHNDGGSVAIDGSTITGNQAGTVGGGVFVDQTLDQEPTEVTITNSTISGNQSNVSGGGVHIDQTRSDVLVSNSTISGNQSVNGGGISFATDTTQDPQLRVQNSTIAGNTATAAGGGIYVPGMDNDANGSGDRATISSSIIADNSAPAGPDLDGGGSGDPTTFELGFSLVEAPGTTLGANTAEIPAGSNITGQDPQLGPLADNGGPTQTHLPALTSPALDAGIANGLATDQRGLQRTFDASSLANAAGSDGTDMGAVELVPEGTCKGKAATVLFAPGAPITGTEGADVIVGTAGADKVNALGGNDVVCSGGGNDKVNAGAGKDDVKGAAGKDKLKGGSGKDKLSGQAGKDNLKGQGGKDTLKGGGGKDKLVGGPGKDKLKGGGGKDVEQQ